MNSESEQLAFLGAFYEWRWLQFQRHKEKFLAKFPILKRTTMHRTIILMQCEYEIKEKLV